MSAVRPADSVRAYFDRNVEEWDVLRYRDETYRSRGRLALDWLKDRPGRQLLDLGCGAGHQSVAATRSGHTVVAMDFSFEMARATRDRLQKEVPDAMPRVVVADALHPPFRPGSFDTVVALGLIGFVPDRSRLMRELHALLQPGGELICDAGLPEARVLFHSLASRTERLLRRLRTRRGRAAAVPVPREGFYSKTFVKHSPEEFDALLQSGGFEPVSRGGAGFGDLRFFQRPLLPWRVEMVVSRLLSELSRLRWGQWLARRALIHVVRASRRDPSLTAALPGRATPYASPPPALLFIANFASNTGYAWSTIEAVFRHMGDRLSALGARPLIAYPSVASGYPEALRGSSLEVIEFDYGSTRKPIGLLRFVRLLRRRNVRVLYLTDLAGHSWRYPLFRLAGVRSIVLHDRTSGERRSATGVRGVLKRILRRVPGLGADCFIGVSDFVADRLVRVGGAPRAQTYRVYNGIDLSRFAGAASALHDELELPRGTRIVFCSGRAQEYKGIHILIEAAALLAGRGVRDVAYVYCGDGPALARLESQVRERALPNFHFLGKRQDVADLLCSSTIAVVPSLWAEAFGLAVVEAMAAGVPVIGSRTGGIPELIEHGETGLLVEPGDSRELSDALERLLADAQLRERMAARARGVARARFSIHRTARELYQIVAPHLAPERSPQERELTPVPAQTSPA